MASSELPAVGVDAVSGWATRSWEGANARWQAAHARWQQLQALAAHAHLQLGRRRMYALLSRRHADSVAALARWRPRLQGSTIVCVGSGPSLLEADPDLLDRFPVLLTNHAARALRRRPARFLGVVITDDYRVQEATRILPDWARPLIVSSHLSTWGDAWPAARIARRAEYALRPIVTWTEGEYDLPGLRQIVVGNYDPGFASDLSEGVWLNRSVIFSAMQISCHVGASRIALLGVDMDYRGTRTHCVPGVRSLMPTFDYEHHARASFLTAQAASQALGVEVVNSTPGGRVDVLRRVALGDL